MKTPLLKVTLLVTSLFLTVACGKDSSHSGGSGDGQQKVAIALKESSTKKVLVDSVKNLRKYLVNADGATFAISAGENRAEWTDEPAKLHFLQAGTVKVLAAHPATGTAVEIVFEVTADDTAVGLDLDDNE